MHLGSAYYPEHRDRSLWAQDATWMREAHLDIARIGDFAWCRMEPEQGVFTLDWIEDAITVLHAEGVRVMLCTPTAGPPDWLINVARTEDDCRMLYEDGTRWEFGGRSMTCVNHPRFQEASRRIAAALAKRFKGHPAVCGWQIDNELGMYGTRCYCDFCVSGFRAWLAHKYGTIAELNRRLGMVFGSNEFRSFADIPMPRNRQSQHSPGLRLDSQRFLQECNAAYITLQADALRGEGATQPTTTNTCHMYSGHQGQDNPALFASCDVAGWDCYPSQFAAHPRPEVMGLLHAAARGYKGGKRFWMLEQQSGSPNDGAADDLRQVRLWTWQAIAHGAEALVYFRWDTCRFGGEQYWRGILDHVTRKNRRYHLIASIGAEVHALAPILDKLERRNRIAILIDTGTCDSFSLNPLGPHFPYRDHLSHHLGALNSLGHQADVVFAPPEPGRYDVLIAVALRLVDAELIGRLRAFVEQGGVLVSGITAATLDREHVAPDQPVPWGLTDVFGCERVEFSALSPSLQPPKERLGEAAAAWAALGRSGAVPILGRAPLSGSFSSDTWCDHLELQGASAWAVFADGSPAAGLAAVTHQRFGAGQAVYLATVLDSAALLAMYSQLIGRNAVAPTSSDPWLEVVSAHHPDGVVHLVLNHGSAPTTVQLPRPGIELLSGKAKAGSIELPAFAVAIIQEK